MSATLLDAENIETLIDSPNRPLGVWASHPVGAPVWTLVHGHKLAENPTDISDAALDMFSHAARARGIDPVVLLKGIKKAACAVQQARKLAPA